MLMSKLLKQNLSSKNFISPQIYASTTKFSSFFVRTTSCRSMHMIKCVAVCKHNEELVYA